MNFKKPYFREDQNTNDETYHIHELEDSVQFRCLFSNGSRDLTQFK